MISPPPSLNTTAALVRFVLNNDGIPIPPIDAESVALPAGVAGVAYPMGVIGLQPYIANMPRDPFSLYVIVHEEMHELWGGCAGTGVGLTWTSLSPLQREACEQAVDSTAKDEMASVYHFFNTSIIAPALTLTQGWGGYTDMVVHERAWSARICHCAWSSPRAMRIRRNWLYTDPTQRVVIT